MSGWVDFKELRAKLDFEQLLRHYGVEVKRKGNQHHGFCPLPNHQGKRNSASFSANLERGIFQCFSCGAQGNVFDFAVLLERASIDDGAAFREVALRLQSRFCPEFPAPGKQEANPAEPNKQESERKRTSPVLIN